MHATSVYIAREQFIHHQTVERTQARSEDFHTHVVRVLLHTRVFMKFKSSCTVQQIFSILDSICLHLVTTYNDYVESMVLFTLFVAFFGAS